MFKNIFFFRKGKPIEEKIMADCGHETKIIDTIIYGEDAVLTKLPITKNQTPYCHECLKKMIIRCAWCGKPIFIGDPITLYSPKEGFEKPDWAISYQEGKTFLVGCPRTDCAETGADYCGYWAPPGKVLRYPSALEIALANPGHAVFKNGDEIKLIKLD